MGYRIVWEAPNVGCICQLPLKPLPPPPFWIKLETCRKLGRIYFRWKNFLLSPMCLQQTIMLDYRVPFSEEEKKSCHVGRLHHKVGRSKFWWNTWKVNFWKLTYPKLDTQNSLLYRGKKRRVAKFLVPDFSWNETFLWREKLNWRIENSGWN